MQSTQPDGSTPFLRVQGLTKKFGGFVAVDGVDLDVVTGEFLSLLGPSGCGKTTILRAIAGLEPQDEGMIEIKGKDVSFAPPAERDFGIVFQSYALFPNLTVEDNVAYGLVNRRRPKAEIVARVGELMEMVGLSDQKGKYPAQLSGGQQQRVALIRALATSPSLLLLDEPLSALDAKVRVRLRELVVEIQQSLGVTTIMVTHDQEEALTMSNRIAVMNDGTIEQIGTPESVYRTPSTEFVADFVGATTFMTGYAVDANMVRIGDLDLAVKNGFNVENGQTVCIAIRPESIQVRDLDGKSVNRTTVQVERLSFLGPFCRGKLVPLGAKDQEIIADFSANVVRDLGITSGQQIEIGISPSDIRVFSASEQN